MINEEIHKDLDIPNINEETQYSNYSIRLDG